MKHQICESRACPPSSKTRRLVIGIAAVAGAAVLAGCAVSVPSGIQPVTNFDVNKYAGKWYELARIDHRFERGLSNTTAQYKLNSDGTLEVTNRGYNAEKKIWKESVGKAKFLKDPKTAALKVSFFGPFYGGYNVVYLDEDYQTALVVGNDVKYFWLLSRTPSIGGERYDELLKKAGAMGVDLSQVMRVEQNK
ncbi:lipocalin family protein [Comamonas terrigena]|uniref:lipocalin family protein n=1 Tax=Comamonas terrigena TaxID=32013 RepID=UPI002448EC7E|nr:lipocalin family protein [Comamonas terrigena]MDH1293875.1 lipocalin family protein [Comamonas terrigena]